MGAYGRTRLAERVPRGATRGLLASMTVPVLMSHRPPRRRALRVGAGIAFLRKRA